MGSFKFTFKVSLEVPVSIGTVYVYVFVRSASFGASSNEGSFFEQLDRVVAINVTNNTWRVNFFMSVMLYDL